MSSASAAVSDRLGYLCSYVRYAVSSGQGQNRQRGVLDAGGGKKLSKRSTSMRTASYITRFFVKKAPRCCLCVYYYCGWVVRTSCFVSPIPLPLPTAVHHLYVQCDSIHLCMYVCMQTRKSPIFGEPGGGSTVTFHVAFTQPTIEPTPISSPPPYLHIPPVVLFRGCTDI